MIKYPDPDPADLLNSALDSYRAALSAMGDSGAQACPAIGAELQQSLLNLRDQLSADATQVELSETERRVEEELCQWGRRADEYFRRKAVEFKEILLVMARAAEATGERDKGYAHQFNALTTRLESFAHLEDLTGLRESLLDSARDLKSCVDTMARDGRESVARLEQELFVYQARLQEAEQRASVDSLTGLANRGRVEVELETLAALAMPFSVVMFDLNEFKQINDTYGHVAGDEVLKQLAAGMRSAFRKTDLVGRWGGDEFIVVLEGSIEQTRAQVERTREWIFGEYAISTGAESRQVPVDGAIGVAEWRPGESIASLIARADSGMYQTKARPRSAQPRR